MSQDMHETRRTRESPAASTMIHIGGKGTRGSRPWRSNSLFICRDDPPTRFGGLKTPWIHHLSSSSCNFLRERSISGTRLGSSFVRPSNPQFGHETNADVQEASIITARFLAAYAGRRKGRASFAGAPLIRSKRNPAICDSHSPRRRFKNRSTMNYSRRPAGKERPNEISMVAKMRLTTGKSGLMRTRAATIQTLPPGSPGAICLRTDGREEREEPGRCAGKLRTEWKLVENEKDSEYQQRVR